MQMQLRRRLVFPWVGPRFPHYTSALNKARVERTCLVDPRLLLVLRNKSNLLVGFSLVVRANLDCHFAVKPFEKIEQLVRGEAAEMPVHQV